MSYFVSTGLVQHMLATGSLLDAIDGGAIRVYGGPVPVDADAALGSAVLLCTFSLDGLGGGLTLEASGRTLRKPAADVWSGTIAATGTPTFFRHVALADSGGASTTALRLQGTVGLTSAYDMSFLSTSFVASEVKPLNSYVIELPFFRT